MVTTRSGRNTENNTKRNTTQNVTTNVVSRRTTQNRVVQKNKRHRTLKNNVSYCIKNNDNIYNSSRSNYDYIYRNFNITDMSDFSKLTKYASSYPVMMYVIRNKNKSHIAYGICETRDSKETFTKILTNNHDVVSQVDFTMNVVLVNYSFVLNKLMHVINYKLNMPHNQSYFKDYYVIDAKMFDKLIKVRDHTLKYIQCMK